MDSYEPSLDVIVEVSDPRSTKEESREIPTNSCEKVNNIHPKSTTSKDGEASTGSALWILMILSAILCLVVSVPVLAIILACAIHTLLTVAAPLPVCCALLSIYVTRPEVLYDIVVMVITLPLQFCVIVLCLPSELSLVMVGAMELLYHVTSRRAAEPTAEPADLTSEAQECETEEKETEEPEADVSELLASETGCTAVAPWRPNPAKPRRISKVTLSVLLRDKDPLLGRPDDWVPGLTADATGQNVHTTMTQAACVLIAWSQLQAKNSESKRKALVPWRPKATEPRGVSEVKLNAFLKDIVLGRPDDWAAQLPPAASSHEFQSTLASAMRVLMTYNQFKRAQLIKNQLAIVMRRNSEQNVQDFHLEVATTLRILMELSQQQAKAEYTSITVIICDDNTVLILITTRQETTVVSRTFWLVILKPTITLKPNKRNISPWPDWRQVTAGDGIVDTSTTMANPSSEFAIATVRALSLVIYINEAKRYRLVTSIPLYYQRLRDPYTIMVVYIDERTARKYGLTVYSMSQKRLQRSSTITPVPTPLNSVLSKLDLRMKGVDTGNATGGTLPRVTESETEVSHTPFIQAKKQDCGLTSKRLIAKNSVISSACLQELRDPANVTSHGGDNLTCSSKYLYGASIASKYQVWSIGISSPPRRLSSPQSFASCRRRFRNRLRQELLMPWKDLRYMIKPVLLEEDMHNPRIDKCPNGCKYDHLVTFKTTTTTPLRQWQKAARQLAMKRHDDRRFGVSQVKTSINQTRLSATMLQRNIDLEDADDLDNGAKEGVSNGDVAQLQYCKGCLATPTELESRVGKREEVVTRGNNTVTKQSTTRKASRKETVGTCHDNQYDIISPPAKFADSPVSTTSGRGEKTGAFHQDDIIAPPPIFADFPAAIVDESPDGHHDIIPPSPDFADVLFSTLWENSDETTLEKEHDCQNSQDKKKYQKQPWKKQPKKRKVKGKRKQGSPNRSTAKPNVTVSFQAKKAAEKGKSGSGRKLVSKVPEKAEATKVTKSGSKRFNGKQSSDIQQIVKSNSEISPIVKSSSEITPNVKSSSEITPIVKSSSEITPIVKSSSEITPIVKSSSSLLDSKKPVAAIVPDISTTDVKSNVDTRGHESCVVVLGKGKVMAGLYNVVMKTIRDATTDRKQEEIVTCESGVKSETLDKIAQGESAARDRGYQEAKANVFNTFKFALPEDNSGEVDNVTTSAQETKSDAFNTFKFALPEDSSGEVNKVTTSAQEAESNAFHTFKFALPEDSSGEVNKVTTSAQEAESNAFHTFKFALPEDSSGEVNTVTTSAQEAESNAFHTFKFALPEDSSGEVNKVTTSAQEAESNAFHTFKFALPEDSSGEVNKVTTSAQEAESNAFHTFKFALPEDSSGEVNKVNTSAQEAKRIAFHTFKFAPLETDGTKSKEAKTSPPSQVANKNASQMYRSVLPGEDCKPSAACGRQGNSSNTFGTLKSAISQDDKTEKTSSITTQIKSYTFTTPLIKPAKLSFAGSIGTTSQSNSNKINNNVAQQSAAQSKSTSSAHEIITTLSSCKVASSVPPSMPIPNKCHTIASTTASIDNTPRKPVQHPQKSKLQTKDSCVKSEQTTSVTTPVKSYTFTTPLIKPATLSFAGSICSTSQCKSNKKYEDQKPLLSTKTSDPTVSIVKNRETSYFCTPVGTIVISSCSQITNTVVSPVKKDSDMCTQDAETQQKKLEDVQQKSKEVTCAAVSVEGSTGARSVPKQESTISAADLTKIPLTTGVHQNTKTSAPVNVQEKSYKLTTSLIKPATLRFVGSFVSTSQCSNDHNKQTVSDKSGTVSGNKGTMLDKKVMVSDKKKTVSDNKGTMSDKKGTMSYNKGTMSDKKVMVSDKKETVSDNKGTMSDKKGTMSDKKVTASDKKVTVSDKKGTMSDKEGMSDKKGTVSDKEGTMSDKKGTMSAILDAIQCITEQPVAPSASLQTTKAEKTLVKNTAESTKYTETSSTQHRDIQQRGKEQNSDDALSNQGLPLSVGTQADQTTLINTTEKNSVATTGVEEHEAGTKRIKDETKNSEAKVDAPTDTQQKVYKFSTPFIKPATLRFTIVSASQCGEGHSNPADSSQQAPVMRTGTTSDMLNAIRDIPVQPSRSLESFVQNKTRETTNSLGGFTTPMFQPPMEQVFATPAATTTPAMDTTPVCAKTPTMDTGPEGVMRPSMDTTPVAPMIPSMDTSPFGVTSIVLQSPPGSIFNPFVQKTTGTRFPQVVLQNETMDTEALQSDDEGMSDDETDTDMSEASEAMWDGASSANTTAALQIGLGCLKPWQNSGLFKPWISTPVQDLEMGCATAEPIREGPIFDLTEVARAGAAAKLNSRRRTHEIDKNGKPKLTTADFTLVKKKKVFKPSKKKRDPFKDAIEETLREIEEEKRLQEQKKVKDNEEVKSDINNSKVEDTNNGEESEQTKEQQENKEDSLAVSDDLFTLDFTEEQTQEIINKVYKAQSLITKTADQATSLDHQEVKGDALDTFKFVIPQKQSEADVQGTCHGQETNDKPFNSFTFAPPKDNDSTSNQDKTSYGSQQVNNNTTSTFKFATPTALCEPKEDDSIDDQTAPSSVQEVPNQTLTLFSYKYLKHQLTATVNEIHETSDDMANLLYDGDDVKEDQEVKSSNNDTFQVIPPLEDSITNDDTATNATPERPESVENCASQLGLDSASFRNSSNDKESADPSSVRCPLLQLFQQYNNTVALSERNEETSTVSSTISEDIKASMTQCQEKPRMHASTVTASAMLLSSAAGVEVVATKPRMKYTGDAFTTTDRSGSSVEPIQTPAYKDDKVSNDDIDIEERLQPLSEVFYDGDQDTVKDYGQLIDVLGQFCDVAESTSTANTTPQVTATDKPSPEEERKNIDQELSRVLRDAILKRNQERVDRLSAQTSDMFNKIERKNVERDNSKAAIAEAAEKATFWKLGTAANAHLVQAIQEQSNKTEEEIATGFRDIQTLTCSGSPASTPGQISPFLKMRDVDRYLDKAIESCVTGEDSEVEAINACEPAIASTTPETDEPSREFGSIKELLSYSEESLTMRLESMALRGGCDVGKIKDQLVSKLTSLSVRKEDEDSKELTETQEIVQEVAPKQRKSVRFSDTVQDTPEKCAARSKDGPSAKRSAPDFTSSLPMLRSILKKQKNRQSKVRRKGVGINPFEVRGDKGNPFLPKTNSGSSESNPFIPKVTRGEKQEKKSKEEEKKKIPLKKITRKVPNDREISSYLREARKKVDMKRRLEVIERDWGESDEDDINEEKRSKDDQGAKRKTPRKSEQA
ncbi:uncharacterized protein LOC116620678 [Nematostella vectensis]|uniref:uncharacterized protein LOC116620678 n=1 Tax=Nematostella vectensis TaxID=45351 RepID=UPI00207760B3|nr:uncharacterized protein LOC116620678 [Nematostella vectensis]